MLKIGYVVPFSCKKMRHFFTLVRANEGYIIQLECPNYFCQGLWVMRGIVELSVLAKDMTSHVSGHYGDGRGLYYHKGP